MLAPETADDRSRCDHARSDALLRERREGVAPSRDGVPRVLPRHLFDSALL